MKKIILSVFTAGLLFGEDLTISYQIDGMMCSMNCPGKVNESLKGVEGIKSCIVDFETKTAIVVYNDDKISSDIIAKTISKATYYKVKEKNISLWEKIFGKG
jgi:copper chaperone CopZ